MISIPEMDIVITFGFGIFIGGLLFNKDFRKKFFKGFANFLSTLAKGQSNQRNRATKIPRNPTPNIQEKYIINHKQITCPSCKGEKFIKINYPTIIDKRLVPEFKSCDQCEGTGKIWT